MKVIYKYRIEVTGEQVITMPKHAKILAVQMQDNSGGSEFPVPMIWAMVDTHEEMGGIKLLIFGTGNSIPDSFTGQYIGTFQERQFVWHLYEEWGD